MEAFYIGKHAKGVVNIWSLGFTAKGGDDGKMEIFALFKRTESEKPKAHVHICASFA